MSIAQHLQALIPAEAVALKLHRIDKHDCLHACETVEFMGGRGGLITTLMRAHLSGRVEVNGKIADHFADVHAANHDLIETVALDAKSYASLKNHWMRYKIESSDTRPVQKTPRQKAPAAQNDCAGKRQRPTQNTQGTKS